jgi:hypothetical protein
MIVSINPPFIFAHISKTGGRSISEALGQYNIHKSRGAKHATIKDFAANSNLQIANFFKFCFVRNPWDRVVSSWSAHFKEESPFDVFVRKIYNKEQPVNRHAISKRQLEWAKDCDFVGQEEHSIHTIANCIPQKHKKW